MDILADRYELGQLLGSGGVASVYRARDKLLERDVAVKLFGPGIDPSGPERERVEMRTLAGLSHPNLVTVHDAGTDTGHQPPQVYLVMALIDGPSLAHALSAGPLAPERVRQIGQDVAGALAYVHSRDVVHRDIKPANILLDAVSGQAFLADFGIAQTIGANALTAAGDIVGTAAFLSPEQVSGHDVSPAADVYALGLVLLEALTGEREYAGTTVETAMARLTRSPRVTERVPRSWESLLTAMTSTDPLLRPPSSELVTLLSNDSDLAESEVGQDAPTQAVDVPGTSDTRLLTTALHVEEAQAASALSSTRARIPRLLVLAGAGLVVLLLVLLVRGFGGPGTTSTVPDPAAGTPGPSRLAPDLTRLHQLVTP